MSDQSRDAEQRALALASAVVTYGSLCRQMGLGWTEELKRRADSEFDQLERALREACGLSAVRGEAAGDTTGARRASALACAVTVYVDKASGVLSTCPSDLVAARKALDGFYADYSFYIDGYQQLVRLVATLTVQVSDLSHVEPVDAERSRHQLAAAQAECERFRSERTRLMSDLKAAESRPPSVLPLSGEPLAVEPVTLSDGTVIVVVRPSAAPRLG